MPALSFWPKVLGSIPSRPRDVTHEALATVRVQVVHHKHPACLRVGGNRLLDMPTEILLRPRRTNRRCDHLSEHHMPIPDQAQRAVTRVFEFDPRRLTGLHRHRLRVPLQRLDARHLVHADRVRVVLEVQFRGFQVALADDLDLLLKELRVFLGGVEPVLAAMRLQFGLGQITIDLTGRDGGARCRAGRVRRRVLGRSTR